MNAFQLMKKIGYSGGAGVSASFDVTIQTSGVDDTFTLPTVSGYTYDAVVDWGDGGATSAITAYDDVDITHTYATEDSYTIKITGTFSAWSFNNGGDKLMVTAVHFGSGVLFENLGAGFYGCSNLATLTGQLGDNGITNFSSCFRSCTSLTAIPAGIFDNNTSAEDFSSCFRSCTSLTAIPAGIFDNNTSVLGFAQCFDGCTSLTGSSGELWLNPSGAGNYTLTAPDYNSGVPNGGGCYLNCTGLSDYASIPTYWK